MQFERKHERLATAGKLNRDSDRPKCRDVHLIARVLFICIVFLFIPSLAHSQKPDPHILILNSYHQGYEWSDKEIAGLMARLGQEYPTIDASIEHLDTKRFPRDDDLLRMKDHLIGKYRGKKIDLIITLDNPALDLALRHRGQFFPEVPIVFAGINDFNPDMLKGYEKVTGVVELQDIAETLKVALKLHPSCKDVLAIHDYTSTGLAARREMESLLPDFQSRVNIRFTPPATFDEVLEQMKSLPPNALAVLLSFATDSSGKSPPMGAATRTLTSILSVPVYSLNEPRLGRGIVGGFLISGEEQGRRAGDIALRVLSREDPAAIPVDTGSSSMPEFDYHQLVRFHIPSKSLPKGSIIINRPISFWETHRTLLFPVLAVVGSLLVLLFGLGTALMRIRRAESRVRRSEEKYRDLYEEAPVGYHEMDTEGRITRVNRKEAEMLGYTAEEMVGRPVWNFVAGKEAKEAEELIKAKIAGHRPPDKGLDRTYRRKDGTTVPVLIEDVLLKDQNGRIAGIRSTLQDITERKQAEVEKEKLQAQLLQAQKMELVGRLAGGVAHDFNNMLGIIIGNADLAMLRVDPSDPLSKSLQDILNASQRSAGLVHQLLAFARKQTVNPRVLDLNDTVSGVLKMLRKLIGEDVDLHWIPGKDVDTVLMDPSQVDQILANLVVNGRDAISGVGTIILETGNAVFDESYCRAHEGALPGEYVFLAVSDTGTGMSRDVMAHIFDPFFTTKEVGKGTGLGLATVYGIVKQNNGFIYVYSEPGQGTTFKIYLPRFQGEAVVAPQEAEAKKLPEGTETVLLAEDEEPLLNISKDILQRQGYTVLAARTPGEAISLAEQHAGAIHLLLTDVVMPEMNGRDLLERIQGLRPAIRSLFMSGYTADVIAHQGVLDEGRWFIQKPFTGKVLAEKVREVLDKAY